MASVRIDALFLLAFFVVLGGVNSAVFQQSGYKHRPLDWSAKMSHLLSLRKNVGNENTAGVENSAADQCLPETFTTQLYTEVTIEEGNKSPVVVFPYVNVLRDQPNKRFATDISFNGVTTWFILLCNGSGATGYKFHLAQQKCRKYHLPGCPLSPDPLCLPPGSTVVPLQLGAGSATFSTQLWHFSSVCSKAEVMGNIVITPKNSAPVAFTGAIRLIQSNLTVTVGAMFNEVDLSPPNPDQFIPPSFCNGEAAGEEEEEEETPEFDVTALFKGFMSFR